MDLARHNDIKSCEEEKIDLAISEKVLFLKRKTTSANRCISWKLPILKQSITFIFPVNITECKTKKDNEKFDSSQNLLTSFQIKIKQT